MFSEHHSLIRASLVAQMVKNLPECWRLEFDPWVGKIPWRRERLPTPVFLPGESHRQRSMVGYRVRHDWLTKTNTQSHHTHGGFQQASMFLDGSGHTIFRAPRKVLRRNKGTDWMPWENPKLNKNLQTIFFPINKYYCAKPRVLLWPGRRLIAE